MWTVRYKYIGTPEHRVGGPWWTKEFDSRHEAISFYNIVKTFCIEVQMKEGIWEEQVSKV